MNPMSDMLQQAGTAAFTGDESKTGLFVGIMIVMAVLIIGLVVFSIISKKKNADNEDKVNNKKDNSKKE